MLANQPSFLFVCIGIEFITRDNPVPDRSTLVERQVHWDCKGRTGSAMTLRDGTIMSLPHEHKQNAKSSTEVQSLNFIRAQGCDVKPMHSYTGIIGVQYFSRRMESSQAVK